MFRKSFVATAFCILSAGPAMATGMSSPDAKPYVFPEATKPQPVPQPQAKPKLNENILGMYYLMYMTAKWCQTKNDQTSVFMGKTPLEGMREELRKVEDEAKRVGFYNDEIWGKVEPEYRRVVDGLTDLAQGKPEYQQRMAILNVCQLMQRSFIDLGTKWESDGKSEPNMLAGPKVQMKKDF